MEEVDLDIDNYDLDELFNLFKIDVDYDKADLKRIKAQVLKFHPDKSGLDAKYFQFFSKAYNLLKAIFEFNNSTETSQRLEYVQDDEDEFETKELLKTFFCNNKDIDFHTWFNTEFETANATSRALSQEIAKELQKQKQNSFKNKNKNEIEIMSAKSSGCLLLEEESANELNDSDLFSNLSFGDLANVHRNTLETTVLETTRKNDTNNRFRSVHELEIFRNNQKLNPLTESESQEQLKNEAKTHTKQSLLRAYLMIKKDNLNQKNKNLMFSKLKLLK
jgi:hypothetical protein